MWEKYAEMWENFELSVWFKTSLASSKPAADAKASFLVAENPQALKDILKVESGQLCYVVGTIYMEMPLKPNVLEDMGRDVSLVTYLPFLTRGAYGEARRLR